MQTRVWRGVRTCGTVTCGEGEGDPEASADRHAVCSGATLQAAGQYAESPLLHNTVIRDIDGASVAGTSMACAACKTSRGIRNANACVAGSAHLRYSNLRGRGRGPRGQRGPHLSACPMAARLMPQLSRWWEKTRRCGFQKVWWGPKAFKLDARINRRIDERSQGARFYATQITCRFFRALDPA